MSSRSDLNTIPELDVDAILEEFHRQETEAAPAAAPKRSRLRPRYTEPETLPPETESQAASAEPEPPAPAPKARAAEPEPPAADPWSQPPQPHTPVATAVMPAAKGTLLYETKPAEETALYKGPKAPAPAAPAARPKKKTRRSAEIPLEPVPDFRAQPSAPRKKKKVRHGLGFALMFVVLLLLAAALGTLLRWNSLTDRETATPEPEALRLELGHSLESLLDEHAGTSR